MKKMLNRMVSHCTCTVYTPYTHFLGEDDSCNITMVINMVLFISGREQTPAQCPAFILCLTVFSLILGAGSPGYQSRPAVPRPGWGSRPPVWGRAEGGRRHLDQPATQHGPDDGDAFNKNKPLKFIQILALRWCKTDRDLEIYTVLNLTVVARFLWSCTWGFFEPE